MQSKRSALRFRSPLRFHDRWEGRLGSIEIEDDWTIANIIARRGLLRTSRVKLPFSIATDWGDDYLSLDCTSAEAFGQQVPPLAVPPLPLSASTPLAAARGRLSGALVDRSSRRVVALLLGSGPFGPGERLVPLDAVTFQGGAIALSMPVEALPLYRRDSELLQALRDALASHPNLTADDRRALTLDVVDAVAFLGGNVRTPQAKASAHAVAAAVPGVLGVQDDITDDRQLEIDVARALDGAGLYRQARIYVRAALGVITLGGFVTSEAAIQEIVRVASRVPGVRSVQTMMELERTAPAA